MEAESKSRITLPDKPKIQAEEIDAALVKAKELGLVAHPAGIFVPITTMQMHDVLEAAFEYRHGLYNKKLRNEAENLVEVLDGAQLALDQIRAAKSRMHADRALARGVRELLDLIKDHPALRVAKLYHNIQNQLNDNPDWNPDWYDEEDEKISDSDF